MNLPRPWTHDIVRYSAAIARAAVPTGACQHKVAKAGLWRVKKPRRPAGVCFAMSGRSEGDLTDVVDLGLKLAREAMARGDQEYAEAILQRIGTVKRDYQVIEKQEEARKLQRLVQLCRQLHRQGG